MGSKSLTSFSPIYLSSSVHLLLSFEYSLLSLFSSDQMLSLSPQNRSDPFCFAYGDLSLLFPETEVNCGVSIGRRFTAMVVDLATAWLRWHHFESSVQFSMREDGVTHVLVTGGAGYIGSHAALRLLKDGYRVTIVDNLSRGNLGAVKPGRLQFIYVDLGDEKAVDKIFSENAFNVVIHFVAVAYVGESTMDPLKPKD